MAETPSLPTGVVTFLLTDVVGSTSLWDEADLAMAEAMARHDGIVAECVASADGVLLKPRGEGDSSFSVFQNAPDAACAAARAQLAIAAVRWDLPRPLQVRMSVHTGEAFERDGDYFGPTVNRAARLRATAVGGQIVLSQATAEAIADHLPPTTRLDEVGTQELAGLAHPERVHELVVEGVDKQIIESEGSAQRRSIPAPPVPARLESRVAASFAGRTFELQRLSEAVARSTTHRQAVLLAGEPGVGKTTLCAHAAAAARRSGSAVLYGRCDEALGRPYQPIAEALETYLLGVAPDALALHDQRQLAELGRVLPRLPSLPQSRAGARTSDPETDRYLLFAAMIGVLERAGAEQPALLVLDDLHWADQSTLLFLRHLLASPEHLRLTVVGTYRDSETAPGHPLTAVLASLRGAPHIEQVTLDGLGSDEIADLLAAVVGEDLGPTGDRLGDELRRETGGNPFFAREVLHQLVEDGTLRRAQDGGWSLAAPLDEVRAPMGVREVVVSRIDRLGDTARHALAAAAVIGRDFDLALLASVTEREDEVVLDLLERAQIAQLVSEDEKLSERFHFTHALIQHALYEHIGTTRRARIHRRVAEALEQLPDPERDERVGELASHWAKAGGPDMTRAIHWARRAADRDLERLAPDDAASWYRLAVELLEKSRQPDRALLCDLLIGAGEAERQAGQAAYRETLTRAFTIARDIGDADRLVDAVLSNSRGFVSSGGQVEADRVAQLDAAMDACGPDAPARARLIAAKAAELLYSGDFETRRRLSDEAMTSARSVGDSDTLLHVLNSRYLTISAPHTLADRRRDTAEAVILAEQSRDPTGRFFAAYNRSQVALEVGDFATADGALGDMAAIAEEVRQPILLWVTSWTQTVLSTLAGDLAGAEALAASTLQLGMDSGQPDALMMYGGLVIGIRWQQGRLGELEPLIAQTVRDVTAIPAYRGALAVARAEGGDLDGARTVLSEMVPTRFAAISLDLLWLVGMTLLGEAAVRVRDLEAARILAEHLAPYEDQVACMASSVSGSVAHFLGGLYSLDQRWDESERAYAKALMVHERLRSPFFVARTKIDWASMLVDRGGSHVSRAAGLARDAREIAERHGFAAVLARADARIAATPELSRPRSI